MIGGIYGYAAAGLLVMSALGGTALKSYQAGQDNVRAVNLHKRIPDKITVIEISASAY